MAIVTRAQLLRMTRRELDALLRRSHPIDPHALDDTCGEPGTEYRGISLGLPRWVERLTWKKFKKVFRRDAQTGAVRGWNVRIQQNALDEPWIPMMRKGAPWSFGHFTVRDDAVLDYGLMRDPLVSLEAGKVDLLLGVSDLALGPLSLRTPTYFCLERDHALGPPAHEL
jgi:hypothetical protein